jgi:type I restriction-modification system DNA methylase subunit
LEELDAYKPLYEIFNQYFGYMNTGRKGKTLADNIPAYNGGLFYTDELLDNLKIDDEILIDALLRLSEYDFNTEVDVNILGHIFEHSLSEIEEITAELSAIADTRGHVPLSGKRKKDGVFYTPKYITQYIVENTIGTLCNEKRKELEIEEIEFDGTYKKKDGTLSVKGKTLFQKLKDYKDWLLSLKIVDPACGSGAFLNQALNFLIQEHKNIDDIIAELTNTALRLFDTDKAILENNLFGVDINEESVEIAKLSLWLRTAHKGRKLSILSNNIKCGNSLIDDPEVAGDKAFDWNNEFPQIFKEKEKKAWHVTTATHNSRYSQRMFDNHVKLGEAVWLSEQDEIIIAEIIADIVKEDKLNILEYNICGDHMHILLVCDENELPKIVGKIKAMTARACNIATGTTIPEDEQQGDMSPLSDSSASPDIVSSGSASPDMIEENEETRGHVPLSMSIEDTLLSSVDISPDDANTSSKEKKKRYNPLWTQKFGRRKITGENDLKNVIYYIRTNRQKHELPENKKLEKIIGEMTCSVENAFRTEYKGGFDVVIGNPPYVRAELLGEYLNHFKQYYSVFNSASDLFAYFYELGSNLINKKGVMGYISNTFDKTTAGKILREYLTSQITFEKYIDFTEVQVFEGATTYPVIITLNKQKPTDTSKFSYIKIQKIIQSSVIDIEFHNSVNVEQDTLESNSWAFLPVEKVKVFQKIRQFPTLREQFGKCYYGVKTALNEAFLVNEDWNVSDHVKYIFEGKEMKKWNTPEPKQKLLLFKSKWTKFIYGSDIGEEEAIEKLKTEFPELMEHLLQFKEKAKKRYDKGDFWWELRNCAYYDLFDKPKIIFPNLQNQNKFCLDSKGVFINAPAVFLPIESKTLLCVLNSKIVWEFLKSICVVRSGSYIEVKPQYFEQIPIPEFKNEETFNQKADEIINYTSEIQSIQSKFIQYLQSQFSIEKLSKKLQNWHELDFGDFIKELNKAIKKAGGEKLSKMDEMEWMEVFETKKAEAQYLKAEIEKTDKEIDQMVYELYGLTEEEIKIVEGN